MENVKYIQNFLTTKLHFVKYNFFFNFFISSRSNIEFFKAYKLQKLEQFETLLELWSLQWNSIKLNPRWSGAVCDKAQIPFDS